MKALIAALMTLTLSSAANALDFKVVEDASTETLLVLHATGTVEYGDYSDFYDLELDFRKTNPGARLHVILESLGGDFRGGIMLGSTFRDLGVSTGVADRTVCAGACAIAWLGGGKDGAPHAYRAPNAMVGFHRPEPEDRTYILQAYANAEREGNRALMEWWAERAQRIESDAYSMASSLIFYWGKTNANLKLLSRLLNRPHDETLWLSPDTPSHNK